MKALVVILNKNNAENLKKCLNSLVNQTAKIGKDFDVLVLDGASTDNSKDVTEEFSKFGVKFKVQERLGGTGFARIEGCLYAIKKGYDVVIWGDSENVYERDYVAKVLEKLKDCDVVGGIPIVEGSFFDHVFAWYHAIHLVVPKLYRRHLPGNNKAEKTWIYREVMYPPSIRAEDYGFSLLLLKNGVKLKQDVTNAIVYVSLPKTLKEILLWQDARAKGVAQALRLIGLKPYDVVAWSAVVVLLLMFSLLALINPLPLTMYSLMLTLIAMYLGVKSKRFIKKFNWFYVLAPLIGIIIYSLYSIKALIYYMRWSNEKFA
jgi:glycosyltransferase involved in cell wall biosynthesis